jgi:hypothetical protein
MPRVSLTDRFVAGTRSAHQTDYFDDSAATPGLALRVSKGGCRTWSFLFTPPGTSTRARMTLGTYPATSLARARTLAIEARGHVEANRDPRRVLHEQTANALTVAALVESFLEKHARPNLRSADEIERRLAKDVLPILGTLKVADLHRRDMNRVVDPVLKRQSPVEAARVFEDLRSVVRWAVARGDLDHNPIDGMKKPPPVEWATRFPRTIESLPTRYQARLDHRTACGRDLRDGDRRARSYERHVDRPGETVEEQAQPCRSTDRRSNRSH